VGIVAELREVGFLTARSLVEDAALRAGISTAEAARVLKHIYSH